MIGQEDVCRRLDALVDSGRLPHALLLCGPEGCGKMAVALRLASRLLCGVGADSCRVQDVSPSLLSHTDLHFAYPVIRPAGTASEHHMSSDDFAKEWLEMMRQTDGYFAIDEWLQRMKAQNQQALMGVGESERLVRRLSFRPARGGYVVCVVWLPERMNDECANKLLKLIEEPPGKVMFIMVCQRPELLLETIRSRTQRIDLHPVPEDDIARALTEQRGLAADDARRVARAADGSWLQALQMLRTDGERHLFLDMFKQLMRSAYRRDVKALKGWTDSVAVYGREKQRRLVTYFLTMVRESFVYNFRRTAPAGSPLADGIVALSSMTVEEEDFARRFAPFINETNVIAMATMMERVVRDIGQNANPRIQFFDMALNTTLLLAAR